ncbi:hypothetical protein J31TS6_32700 [Brevibacillus reuszeri]|nr:hypothetical protein J31TS6_32700 [Brevibacillus reuszeri]
MTPPIVQRFGSGLRVTSNHSVRLVWGLASFPAGMEEMCVEKEVCLLIIKGLNWKKKIALIGD